MKKILFLLVILNFSSCTKEIKIIINQQGKALLNKDIQFQINNINKNEIDKIKLWIDQEEILTTNYSEKIKFVMNEQYKLGNHVVKLDFIKNDKTVFSTEKKITLYAQKEPKLLKYRLINTYPHDIDAFTQGLEFVNDTLFEGTGLNGKSSLRKVNYKTGKILQKIDLDRRYFGEGITVLNHKIYQLTWQNGIGFVYEQNDMNKISEFKYKQSKEGWGLCNDGKHIYKSDGTERIWLLNPDNLEENDFFNVYTNTSKVTNINEMEWVNGKIYTNVWQKNAIAIINPKNGCVESVIDLSELHKQVTQHPNLDVLNGIAYHKQSNHIFVTGKLWDKLFEIEILKE